MSVVARWLEGSRCDLVGLGPGDIVSDGYSRPPPPKKGGTAVPHFSAHLLWSNGWMDQDAIWYGDWPRPRPRCVRWGPGSALKKGGTVAPPIFGPCLLWPNSWMDQDATWYGGRPRPWPYCVRWGPSPLPNGAQPPNLRLMSVGAKRLDGSRCHLVRR